MRAATYLKRGRNMLLRVAAPAIALLAASLLSPVTAYGQASATVVCPNGGKGEYSSITAALAANAPKLGPLVIAASGTCTENIDLSRLSGVTINGNPTVTITPSTQSSPTVLAGGTTNLYNVAIVSGTSGVAIAANPGTTIILNAVSVTGSGAGITAYVGATLDILNSSVAVTGGDGIFAQGSTVTLAAFGTGSTSVSSSVDGIYCQQSQLHIQTDSTANLSISGNSNNGINGIACNINTFGANSPIVVSNNGASGGSGIAVTQGSALLSNVQVTSNTGYGGGIAAYDGASVAIGGSNIQNNSPTGIVAQQNSVIHWVPYWGNGNTVQNDGTNFSCSQGGIQYVDTAGTITPKPKASKCVKIGG